MLFQNVIGQEDIKRRLVDEVNEGRIPHALLFCGNEGVGKFPLALAFARYLLCNHRTDKDACGKCPACVKMDKLVHPDLHFVFPIIKNAKAKKEICDDYLPDWRHFVLSNPYFNLRNWTNAMEAENTQALISVRESDELTRKLNLKAMEGGYKIVILWLPEKLHESCANKLLKLLEEPPEQTLFMLVSEAPEAILTTIQSRTQRINIHPVAEADIAEALQSRYGIAEKESQSIAHLASGNYLQALETIQHDEETRHFFELFVSLMRLSYQRKIKEMKQWSEEVAGLGREKQKNFLNYCQRLLRENFMFNFRQPSMTYMSADEQAFSTRFAPFINERNVYSIMNELSEAEAHIGQNVNAKMVFFDFSLKMIVLLKQ